MSTDDYFDDGLDDDEIGGFASIEPPRHVLVPDLGQVVGLVVHCGGTEDGRSIAIAMDPVPVAPGDQISIVVNGKDSAVLVERPEPPVERYREKAEEIVECMVNCDLNEEESITYVANILQDIMEKGL